MDVTIESVAEALEREHQEVDAGIEAFAAGVAPRAERLAVLVRAVTTLRRHIYVEEEFLFPALCDVGFEGPVHVMQGEHGQVWQVLDMLEEGQRGGAADEQLIRLCHRLAADLQQHNLKEEHVLYPRIDDVLAPGVSRHVLCVLESGDLPAGWTCRRA